MKKRPTPERVQEIIVAHDKGWSASAYIEDLLIEIEGLLKEIDMLNDRLEEKGE